MLLSINQFHRNKIFSKCFKPINTYDLWAVRRLDMEMKGGGYRSLNEVKYSFRERFSTFELEFKYG